MPEKLKGIVEADETYVLESRKGRRKLDREARRRGGKATKRGLSKEQVPVLVAVDRDGAPVSTVLPEVTGKALAAALEPVLAPDVLLVSDGGSVYALRRPAERQPRGPEPRRRRASPG